jgi:hypothetical protein
MPADQHLWRDDHQHLTPVDKSRQRNERDAGRIVRVAGFHLPLEVQRQLLAQKQVLGGEIRTRPQYE